MADLIGHTLGRYHILEQLGEGGMATVYKAYDTKLETEAAVKVIRTENILPSVLDRALKRFEHEAKALSRLSHPNIVRVTDYGEYNEKPYLVMPYLPGGTLKQKLGKPIPWREAIVTVLPIADALGYAHSQKMVHRDVKPSNILLTMGGQPMLSDFGVAKTLDREETLDLTGTSAAVGTPEYMAPEQATARTTDHRVDIYALGVVLYEMITGRKPFLADTPMAILIKHATAPLPRPKQFVPNLPDAIEKILLKALAKKPEDRFQSMSEMRHSLASMLDGRRDSLLREEAEPQVVERIAHKITPSTRDNSVRPLSRRRPFLRVPGIAAIVISFTLTVSWVLTKLPPMVPTGTASMTQPAVTPATATSTTSVMPTISPATLVPSATAVNVSSDVWPAELVDIKGVPMVLVPGGEFTMGSESGEDDEKPVHIVFLHPFYIDKYEVTNALYKECVDAGVCIEPQFTRRYINSQYSNEPVVYVNWDQAQAFCAWRGAGLPTEAQWEKAARGTDARIYPWGEAIACSNANYRSCTSGIIEVGSLENGKSPYGLYDMAGNVWEWTADWYSETYYQSAPYLNPLQSDPGEYRGLRGGAWSYVESDLRTSNRRRSTPDTANKVIGFRCAREPIPR